jgi:hypothetical protein
LSLNLNNNQLKNLLYCHQTIAKNLEDNMPVSRKPVDTLQPEIRFCNNRTDAYAAFETVFNAQEKARFNLRRSEAIEYMQRYSEKIVKDMKLPPELTATIKLEDHKVVVIIQDPNNPMSERFEAKWAEFLKTAFEKAKESALAELGDPEVHDHNGNVISGPHARRAQDGRSGKTELGG